MFFMSGSLNVSAPWVCGLNTNANCYIMNERFTQGIKISSWPLLHHHLISGTRTSWAWQFLCSISPSASTFRILKLVWKERKTCFCYHYHQMKYMHAYWFITSNATALTHTRWWCWVDAMIRGDLSVFLAYYRGSTNKHRLLVSELNE